MMQKWLEEYRARRLKKPAKPVFRTIFTSMMLVLLAEVMLMVISITATNVSGQLDQNAEDILTMQVRNRASYIQDIFQDAQDLVDLSSYINTTTRQLLDEGVIALDTLDDGTEQSDALLEAIAPELLSTLRAKSVTGIFVVLNTQDLNTCEVGTGMPGIYLRDLDPDARPSERNTDLLLERASAAVVKTLGITIDKGWKPTFAYQGNKGNGFMRVVFQTAYETAGTKLAAEDYGRWTTTTYRMVKDDRPAIAYSQPLILPDGTVYGVVGVEMLTSYLEEKLPYAELQENNCGTYFLMSTTDDLSGSSFSLTKAVTSGADPLTAEAPAATIECRRNENGCWFRFENQDYYAAMQPLTLYNRNAPFSDEKWLLVGTTSSSVLFAFSRRVQNVLRLAILITLVLGVLASLVVSGRLALPINRLYREVVDAQEKKSFPQLSRTGIREMDRFAETITQLNSELVTNSTKFLRIMDMASVELGGYELRFDTGSVFVTDNFFKLLGMSNIHGSELSVRKFEEVLNHIQLTRPCTRTAEGDSLLTIRQEGEVRYIMLRVTTEGRAQIGLAEDVTAATLERMRIEHERDYDILTGLYNRQAFNRVCEELFTEPSRLGVAALLMMDLDNLKHVNDTYGHDWGDQYIHRTGQCLAKNTPTGTICARLSGDEFMVLFYGYHAQEQIREKIATLDAAMRKSVAVLPSGSELRISLSGGVAWFPKDGRDLSTLKKYADFAMYQVKHASKGRIAEFDLDVYKQEAYAERTRREFHQLISKEQVRYYFQPIFSARTGRVNAYEALMRSNLPTLRSPATIMKLAREQGALYEIERITFFKASETFEQLQQKSLVRTDALLFINSIANVCLTESDSANYRAHYAALMQQLVVEITEEEELNHEALETKRRVPGFSGMFALDDYGSGYSNEGSLLELSPRFIKVDISIIRGIDTDADKQQIMRNVVAYAHPRSMQIIAEGVETAAEMRKAIELGADLLQGYYLARPAAVPESIAPEAYALIRELRCSEEL